MEVFNIKTKDTKPVLAVTLNYANGSPVDLTGGSVWFNMATSAGYTPFYSGLATITGSSTGNVEYRWTGSTDTSTAGNYFGEFEINWGNGSIMTLPNDHSLKIEISQGYNN